MDEENRELEYRFSLNIIHPPIITGSINKDRGWKIIYADNDDLQEGEKDHFGV